MGTKMGIGLLGDSHKTYHVGYYLKVNDAMYKIRRHSIAYYGSSVHMDVFNLDPRHLLDGKVSIVTVLYDEVDKYAPTLHLNMPGVERCVVGPLDTPEGWGDDKMVRLSVSYTKPKSTPRPKVNMGIGLLGDANISFKSGMRYVAKHNGQSVFIGKPLGLYLCEGKTPIHNTSFWTMDKFDISLNPEEPLKICVYSKGTGEIVWGWIITDIRAVSVLQDEPMDGDDYFGRKTKYNINFGNVEYVKSYDKSLD
jgi:hypothetical protein